MLHARRKSFFRGTTEAINLVANSYGRENLKNGEEIILSEMEHHANIVPWQMVTQMTGAVIRVIPTTDSGELDMLAYANMLGPKTKIIGITHVYNMLGTINPVAEVCAMARAVGEEVLLTGLNHCLISRSMCNHWVVISSLFPDIKFLHPPVLALFMDAVTY